MAEYRLDVRPFFEEIGSGVNVVDSIEFGDLVVGEETFVMRGPVTVDVTVSNAGEGFVALGTVTAPVRATCSRCLCEFDMEITGDVEGFWVRPGERLKDDADTFGEVDSEGRIDLWPALTAALVVEAPFVPLHSQDCAGLCATCGADLNEGECGCAAQGTVSKEHPFAALQSLLEDESEAEKDDR